MSLAFFGMLSIKKPSDMIGHDVLFVHGGKVLWNPVLHCDTMCHIVPHPLSQTLVKCFAITKFWEHPLEDAMKMNISPYVHEPPQLLLHHFWQEFVLSTKRNWINSSSRNAINVHCPLIWHQLIFIPPLLIIIIVITTICITVLNTQ